MWNERRDWFTTASVLSNRTGHCGSIWIGWKEFIRKGKANEILDDDVAGLRARGCIRANQWCAIDDGSNRSDHALAGWLDRQFQQGRCGSVAHASGHECGGDLAERGSVDGAGRGAGILQPNDERRAAGGAVSEREAGDFRTAYVW